MSKVRSVKRQSVATLRAMKEEGRKISSITCYDAAFARILEKSPIDLVLVGDSLGNVILGHDDTIPVTLEDMIHHTQAVSRVLTKPFLCSDMPFLSYQVSVEEAVRNAGRLFKEGGAQAVKLEGGETVVPQIRAITAAGMPVIGHLGFTPQSVHAIGGPKVQGKTESQRERLLKDAELLEKAGVSMLVLEMVPADVARELTKALSIPTIGIGAGPDCDGQILVLHDMLGFDPEFRPKFLKTFANLHDEISKALNQYDSEVKDGIYPAREHSF